MVPVWSDILTTTGVVAAIIAAGLALVRIAVGAERRRADDWRTAAQISSEANTVLTGHFDKLVTSIEQLTASQRDMMTVLQSMAAELRAKQ